jgi:hypothetical protein
MTTQNPELAALADRLADAERQTDAARELARTLLHELTDARLALDAIAGELRDLDARPLTLLAGTLPQDDLQGRQSTQICEACERARCNSRARAVISS